MQAPRSGHPRSRIQPGPELRRPARISCTVFRGLGCSSRAPGFRHWHEENEIPSKRAVARARTSLAISGLYLCLSNSSPVAFSTLIASSPNPPGTAEALADRRVSGWRLRRRSVHHAHSAAQFPAMRCRVKAAQNGSIHFGGLGLVRGVTQRGEFLKAHADNRFYFLEIAARVGGAYISPCHRKLPAGSIVGREWARLDVGAGKQPHRFGALAG